MRELVTRKPVLRKSDERTIWIYERLAIKKHILKQ